MTIRCSSTGYISTFYKNFRMSDPFDLADTPPNPSDAELRPVNTPYLSQLNTEQIQAVETVDGPVLVLAGAGTGKTRVLTTRLAYLLNSGRAQPGQTLTVTFTNKAAREMRDRVEALINRTLEGWYLGTFHSIGARILRQHAEAVGLKSNFTILDTDDQLRVLKQVLEARDIDEKRWPARSLGAIISRWKDRGVTSDQVTDAEGSDFADGRSRELYHDYQKRLQVLNAADFGDLLLHNLTLFMEEKEVLRQYQNRFQFILVDEYQDTNVAQYLWLRLLAQGSTNICCVGDDDQSIYAWRGAEVGNILRFEKDFPGARVIRLERNYRSTPHILGAASNLIACNHGRLGKTLWTETNEGEKVRVLGFWDGENEARAIGERIETQGNVGHSLNNIAVLVRAGHQTRPFEERFIQIGLPYRVNGVMRFYERLEIRDAIAYLRVVAQNDDDLAFERIVNRPKRGIGQTSLQKLHVVSRANKCSLMSAARDLVESDELKGAARNGLKKLIHNFGKWNDLSQAEALPSFTQTVLEESGYLEMWRTDRSIQAPGRLENLNELISALEEFDTLDSFLEHISLVMDNAETVDGDMVNIMTLHGAKGLEFDTVYLPGWEEGLFPHQRALDEGGSQGLEEERRLAYVGLTRARLSAVISYAANRNLFGTWNSALPSRFISELPDEHVIRTSQVNNMVDTPEDWAVSTPDRPHLGQRRSNWTRYTSKHQGNTPQSIAKTEHAPGVLQVGKRIFHQKFGYGKILDIDGNKLEVSFEKAGEKKVMANYVEPA